LTSERQFEAAVEQSQCTGTIQFGRFFKGVWLSMKYEIAQMLKQESGSIASPETLVEIEATAALTAFLK
jgi:hypothetical protein